MKGVDKAAILLLGMGEAQAARVLKHLDHKQIQILSKAMASVTNTAVDKVDKALDNFITSFQQQTALGVDAEQYTQRVLKKALGDDIAAAVMHPVCREQQDSQGLEALKWMDAQAIGCLIKQEHPQVIATLLTCLDSEQAAQVMQQLGEPLSTDIILRVATLESIDPSALFILNDVIEKQFLGKKRMTKNLGGIEKVAEIMSVLDKRLESSILDGIKAHDESLSDEIQDLMFVFDDLISLDIQSMQTLLRAVPNDILLLALKGSKEQLQEKIFSSLSQRAALILKDDLDVQAPARVVEVEAAQKEILNIAKQLAASQKIVLNNAGDEMI